LATKPDYEKTAIGPLGRWMDLLFLRVFRRKLAGHVGGADSSRNVTDFMGIIDLAAAMNRRFSQGKIHSAAQQVLRELFPSWMPGSYAVLFSKPFPAVRQLQGVVTYSQSVPIMIRFFLIIVLTVPDQID
jgi:hypothetical protein